MTSGVAFLFKSVLDVIVGDPPPAEAQTLAWVTSHQLALSLTNEVFFFAAIFLIPAVLTLYRNLEGSVEPQIAFGCTLLAVTVPVILLLVIVQGRLVYPVYGIDLRDSTVIALVVSLYYGGAHMVALLWAASLIMLGLGSRRGPDGRAAKAFPVAVGSFQIIGAYPWFIGPVLASVIQAAFAAWLVWVGMRLTRSRAFS